MERGGACRGDSESIPGSAAKSVVPRLLAAPALRNGKVQACQEENSSFSKRLCSGFGSGKNMGEREPCVGDRGTWRGAAGCGPGHGRAGVLQLLWARGACAAVPVVIVVPASRQIWR